jgi:hypothetical protein
VEVATLLLANGADKDAADMVRSLRCYPQAGCGRAWEATERVLRRPLRATGRQDTAGLGERRPDARRAGGRSSLRRGASPPLPKAPGRPANRSNFFYSVVETRPETLLAESNRE